MLPFLGYYLHIKNQRNWLLTLRDNNEQRPLRSVWTGAFWPITCKQEFSQIWGLNRKIENCNVYNFRLLPAKTNDKKIIKSQKNLQIGFILGPFYPF